MIELNEGTYCLGAWLLSGPRGDWLGIATRQDDEPLILRYRFRWNIDRDVARWCTAIFRGKNEDHVIAAVDALLASLRRDGFSDREPWKRIIRGDAEKTVAVLRNSPFFRITPL